MKFYKYYANGNDFIIFELDKLRTEFKDKGFEKGELNKLALLLCDRFKGIGADGLIAVLKHDRYDFEWDFYNCDGSKASMCGNGSRAAAHFAKFAGLAEDKMSFLTGAGVINASVENLLVEVELGGVKDVQNSFEFDGELWQKCDSGVPHLVCFVDDLAKFNLQTCRELRQKYNANVNYARILGGNEIAVRTFERGVENETLACGTGMGACFYLANLQKLVKNTVKVTPKSGKAVFFRLENNSLFFKGEVRMSFEANYHFS